MKVFSISMKMRRRLSLIRSHYTVALSEHCAVDVCFFVFVFLVERVAIDAAIINLLYYNVESIVVQLQRRNEKKNNRILCHFDELFIECNVWKWALKTLNLRVYFLCISVIWNCPQRKPSPHSTWKLATRSPSLERLFVETFTANEKSFVSFVVVDVVVFF